MGSPIPKMPPTPPAPSAEQLRRWSLKESGKAEQQVRRVNQTGASKTDELDLAVAVGLGSMLF